MRSSLMPADRTKVPRISSWIIGMALLAVGCRSPYFADRGAAVGALTGAVAGAAIGENNGDAASGALIGTAVGALAGTAIGDAMDQEVARNQVLIEQRLGRPLQGATTVSDVITMSQAGLSDEVIITHIRAHGVAQPPQVPDLLTMRDAGVHDSVIRAMQQTPIPAPAAPPARPVIVEEHVYVAPRYHWYPTHHHHPRPYPPPRRGVHWGISFSN